MTKVLLLLFLAVFVVCSAREICAQTTEFTYQGSMKDGANAANGSYDFEFALFDALSAGGQIGSTISKNNVPVANGIFTVKLDFGSVFPGTDRYLEIRVRLAGQPGITTLAPRQLVNSAPYSVKSLNANTATAAANASQLGGIAANQYVVTTDPRMTDARPPTAGSSDYIQNGTTQQSGDFNIAGNGIISGNVGIGTLLPEQKFHLVSGTADIQLGSPSGADGIEIKSSVAGHSPAIFLNHTGTGGRKFRIVSFGDNTNSGKFVIRDDSIGADRIQIDSWGRTVNTFGDPFFISTGEAGGAFTFNRVNTPNFLGVSVERTNGLNGFDGAGLINIGVNTGREGPFNSAWNGYWLRADSRPGNFGFHFFRKAFTSGVETELFTINDAGNVGIGTSAPDQKLHVDGTSEILSTGSGAGFKFRDRGSASSADDWVWYSNANVARFFRSGTGDLITAKTNGNVGIGTANPNTKLQIAGSVYIQNPSSLIITSPNGACWFITVNNAGALSTISVTCP